MKVYEAVLDVLVRAGVRNFAGMVGSTTAPYVAGLDRIPEARYVPVRHEQVAGSIIDAAGRLTGVPGCVLVHGASGALAASLGIAAAARDFTPMVVLSCTQERVAMEQEYWQTLSVLGPMEEFVKWQTRVERPDAAVRAVQRAIREAVSGRPGVTQVDLPIDVSAAEYDGPPADEPIEARVPLHRAWPAPDAIARVRDLAASAERPVIVAGAGAGHAGAGAAVLALAERLHAPVAVSATARGVVPEHHELSVGPTGILGFEAAGRAIAEADLVIGIGCRLSDMQLARGELLTSGTRVVHADIDASALGRYHAPHVPVLADALAFSEELGRALDERPVEVPAARRDWVKHVRDAVQGWIDGWLDEPADASQVQPQEVVRALREQLPPESILTHGAGDHGFYGMMVPVAAPGSHLISAKLGAMGCALGYALGARMVRPSQPVVACVGDGEFMIQIGDLETMVREDLPVVVVVFNNFRLGSQRKRVEVYGRPVGVDHTNPDFARLAELFGADGYRVDQPGAFAEALAQALASGRPAVIDVIVDPEARPPRIAISREAR